MRKFLKKNTTFMLAWLCLTWMVFLSPAANAQMGTPVSLVIDGQTVLLTQPAMILNGRVMIPLRAIFERLDASVRYDPNTRAITLNKDGQQINLALGARVATINGVEEALDAPPVTINGRVMVPLRFVSEALGTEVTWMAVTRTVNIVSRTGGVNVSNPTEIPVIPQQSSGPNASISGISISPKRALPGETVTVTMNGTPNGNAAMTLGSSNQIPMTETSPGQYVGTYVIPAGVAGMEPRDLDVTVNLSLSSGQTNSLTNSHAVSVRNPEPVNAAPSLPGGVLPLELISPNPAANVPQFFDLTGRTEPKALVRARLVDNGNKELYNSQTFADQSGNFHFQVDTGNLGKNTHLILFLKCENSLGKTSEQMRVELTKQ